LRRYPAHKNGCKISGRTDDAAVAYTQLYAGGRVMKKIAFLLLAAAVVATPAVAASKKKAPKMTEAEAQRDASWRLVKGSVPFFIPSLLKPIYFHMQDEEAKKDKGKKKDKM
jgi:hypothetical protein